MLLNYKYAGGFNTSGSNDIIPALPNGESRIVVEFIITNMTTQTGADGELLSADVVLKMSNVVFAKTIINPGQSYYFDLKLFLTQGDSITLETNVSDLHVIVSADDNK